MYELYKNDKPKGVAVKIIFTVLALLFPAMLINDVIQRGFSFNTIMFGLVSLIFIAIAVATYTIKIDSYEKIKKWKERDPQLVADMERDFTTAVPYGRNIYRGQRYYFIVGMDFFVIPIGQFTYIEHKDGYIRSLGSVSKCTFQSKDGEVQLDIANFHQSKEECSRLLNAMAYESGITVKYLKRFESEK